MNERCVTRHPVALSREESKVCQTREMYGSTRQTPDRWSITSAAVKGCDLSYLERFSLVQREMAVEVATAYDLNQKFQMRLGFAFASMTPLPQKRDSIGT